jgi:hypothetical protein
MANNTISRKQVAKRVSFLQRDGFNIDIDNAYGQDQFCNKGQSKNYTPRTTPSNNYHYVLNGIEAGINLERERIQTKHASMIAWLKEQHADMPEVAAFLQALSVSA